MTRLLGRAYKVIETRCVDVPVVAEADLAAFEQTFFDPTHDSRPARDRPEDLAQDAFDLAELDQRIYVQKWKLIDVAHA